MSEQNGWATLREYLRAHRFDFIGFLVTLFIFFALFLLYGLPLYVFGVATGWALFVFGMGHAFRFSVFRQSLDYRALAERQGEELRNLQAERAAFTQDLEDYFLTWAHQLKTPLTAVQLIAAQEAPMDEHDKRALEKGLVEIETYTNMAMSYIKVTSPTSDLDIARTSLDPLIRELLRRYARFFIDQHLSLHYEPMQDDVYTDGRWFSLLFEQLLSNSLKYTKEGGITIVSPEVNVLVLRDTGIGIRESDLPRVFDRGYSGWNGRTGEHASGIGLYLAKRISQKLSIQLTLESTWGEGTTVTLVFPPRFER